MRQQEVPSEQHLAEQWRDLPRGQQVVTRRGTVLRVRYPGRPNPESGPDFLGAILETEAGEVRGAVELHRRTSDWQRHGHGADPRYGDVVLHVVGRDDGAVSLLPGGGQLPLVELSQHGAVAWDGELRFPCAVRTKADWQSVANALGTAGEARFRAMVTRLGHDLSLVRENPLEQEQVLFVEIASALGYSRNVEAMRALASLVPLRQARALARLPDASVGLEAAYLGSAGLLPSARHLATARRKDPYVQLLESAWRRHESGDTLGDTLRSYRWDFTHVRPENAPVRRVVGLAHLAHHWPEEGLLYVAREALMQNGKEPAHRRLAQLVTVECPSGYWGRHWDFGVTSKRGAAGSIEGGSGRGIAALIGPSRAADIVVNTLLPALAGLGELQDDGALVERAWECYRAHPLLAENWITRLVRQRCGGQIVPEEAKAGTALITACVQQGLIGVYEQTCHALNCKHCPLATTETGFVPPLPQGEGVQALTLPQGSRKAEGKLTGDLSSVAGEG